jgi:hypothetical protein
MGLNQIKNLLPIKKAITRVKRQPRGWEKIFGIFSTEKGLIPRIYNKSKKLNTKRTWIPINNVQINGTVFRSTNGKYIYVEMFYILSYKEMQIKNYTQIPSHPSKSVSHQETNMVRRMWGRGTLIQSWWKCKQVQPL